MNKIKVFILLVTGCLLSVSSYGQIDFKQPTLGLLQSIAFESTYDNIIPLFKSIRIELKDQRKNEDKTETFSFKVDDQKSISLLYSEKKKLIYAYFSNGLLATASYIELSGSYVEMEKRLNDNHFKSTIEEPKGLFSVVKTRFKKESYPYEFILKGDRKFFNGVYIFNLSFGDINKFII